MDIEKITVEKSTFGVRVSRDGTPELYLQDDEVFALRQFFANEPKIQPWDNARANEVWKIKHFRHDALIWRDNEGEWTVIGPNGESKIGQTDVIATLKEMGYDDFEEYDAAHELKEA